MISPQQFSNLIYSNGAFSAHNSGHIYHLDLQLNVQNTTESDLFSGTSIYNEPIVGEAGTFTIGRDRFNQTTLFHLTETSDIRICEVAENAILAQLNGGIFVFIGRKCFVLEESALVFLRSIELAPRQVFTDSECFILVDGATVVKLDATFTMVNSCTYESTLCHRVDQLLLDENFKQPLNLDSLQRIKSDQIEKEDVSRHFVYSAQCFISFDKIAFYRKMLDEKKSKVEIQKELVLMQESSLFERSSYIQFSRSFLQTNPNIPRPLVIDYECAINIVSEVKIGQLVNFEYFNFKFYLNGLFYGVYDRYFLGINDLGSISSMEVLGQKAPREYFVIDGKRFGISNFQIFDENLKLFCNLPFQNCFFQYFIANKQLYILAQQDVVNLYILQGNLFSKAQGFSEILEFTNVYYFNKQLFIIGNDENTDKVMFIYAAKNNTFTKSDDMILDSIGRLEYFCGILVDCQNNRIMDLESRVFYKRLLPQVVFYRKKIYSFGISLAESFLDEFENFQVEFWKIKMEGIFNRNEKKQ
ncbi:hypothetical protein SS50377_26672 [Spironucleus salmonicida]|uniref:Uncharacterized protein n=1 Tax=Spironucleus salmonicida TaxID=348837 RepID=V6M6V0_9EUKA|nr:hypothetical protein SS50377_26672 [Spironucleus salmonicida]|eukprot:EST49149.1 Hypothetical protein SS50377_10361 [Spironucleus salmonicida]